MTVASTTPPQAGHTQGRSGNGIGWTLLIALVVAVAIAISMAVQLRPERASPEPPGCGGLYDECCVEWEDNRGPCLNDECPEPVPAASDGSRDDRGLFDAEENFANRQRSPNC